ncbi:MAG: hypothetical protein ACI934_001032, partial [Pseudohongiellaceae bacterium]
QRPRDAYAQARIDQLHLNKCIEPPVCGLLALSSSELCCQECSWVSLVLISELLVIKKLNLGFTAGSFRQGAYPPPAPCFSQQLHWKKPEFSTKFIRGAE